MAVAVVYSFDELVPPQRPDLLAYAIRLCRSRQIAEDVLQDAMVKALEAWERFQPADDQQIETSVRSWLFVIVYNCFVNTWRTRGRRGRLGERYSHEAPRHVDPRENPTAGYSDEITEALSTLEPDYRQVLLMYAEGKIYREIAEALDVPIGTVMSRLYRARQAVKAKLAAFASAEYGLGRERTRVDVPRREPAQDVETDSDTVKGVVAGLDDEGLGVAEPLADAQAAG